MQIQSSVTAYVGAALAFWSDCGRKMTDDVIHAPSQELLAGLLSLLWIEIAVHLFQPQPHAWDANKLECDQLWSLSLVDNNNGSSETRAFKTNGNSVAQQLHE